MNGSGGGDDEDERGECDVPSPCTGVCVMDSARRLCLGCKRTLGEITAWGALTNDEKRAIVQQLPARR